MSGPKRGLDVSSSRVLARRQANAALERSPRRFDPASVEQFRASGADSPGGREFLSPDGAAGRPAPLPVVWSVLGVFGEIAITLGVVVLLFLAWDLWGTGWATDRAQTQLATTLDDDWHGPLQYGPVAVGSPLWKLHVPAFGAGWTRTVLEGTDQQVLASGPGHYPGTGLPGVAGNVAVAGHRVSHGAPFDPAGTLRSCDALVLETRDGWYVYRVLPTADERATWDTTAAARPQCHGIKVLTGAYAKTVGVEIVSPQAYDVVAPIPHETGATPTGSLLTLTTCNPRFSSRQRLVIHAVLAGEYPKRDHPAGWQPAELVGG